MKYLNLLIIISIGLLFSFMMNSKAIAQFTGGSGAGYDAETGFANVITGESLGPIFAGGSGAGHSKGDYETPSFELTGVEGYRMLSAPANIDLADFLEPIWTQGAAGADTESGPPNVFIFDYPKSGEGEWLGLTDLNQSVPEGTGILVYVFEDDDFSGEADPFPKSLNTYFGGFSAADISPEVNPSNESFTLLGNPFPGTLEFGSIDRSEMGDVIYIWDVNDDDGDGGTGDGSTNPGAGSWKTYSLSGMGDITGGLISPFQGFMIYNDDEVTDPSITFPVGSQTTGGEFLGRGAMPEFVRLEVRGEGMSSSMWLGFSENGSMERLPSDALKLESLSQNHLLLAVSKADVMLDIAEFPHPEAKDEYPLDLQTTISGSYTISATDFELSGNKPLYFLDLQEDVALLIDESFEYNFTLETDEKAKTSGKTSTPTSPQRMQRSTKDTGRFMIQAGDPVESDDPELPSVVALDQNYPNPFNPTTQIAYDLPENAHVRIDVYNVMGQRVATLVNSEQNAGSHTLTFNGRALASGVYLYRLQTGSTVITRKMMLVK